MTSHVRINEKRLLADIEALSLIGRTHDGGVHRPALSDADLEARTWFREHTENFGFTFKQDNIGNISAFLPTSTPNAKTVMFGSHLDTVPHGGRFDGSLGVVAALEVLRTIKETNLKLPCHLKAISFTDEEGTATGNGLLGSRGLAGLLTIKDFKHPKRENQAALEKRLDLAGINVNKAIATHRDPKLLKAWVEVHIEQGPRLDEAGIPIGVVSSIVGIYTYWFVFQGQADHSGTVSLNRRRDALQGAALFVRRSRELVMDNYPDGRINCGIIDVSPGAFNVVPHKARLAVEVRHSDTDRFKAMQQSILDLGKDIAERANLKLEIKGIDNHEPVALHPDVMHTIEDACQMVKLPWMQMASYAGHDTQIMAKNIPAGMFFVPSVSGRSHSSLELTYDEDCINAGNVLLHTVIMLANS